MKIALFGTGMIGSRIAREALSRGHQVTVVARTPGKVPKDLQVQEVQGDARDADSIARAVRGHDAVISAVGVGTGEQSGLLEASKALLEGVKQAGVPRLLVVGGAGSLEVKPGVQLVDLPEFPAAYKAPALAHREVLGLVRQADLDWTYLSPAAVIAPGERTGKFRLGGEQLVADAKGESRISAEDYAVAMIDELERPCHIRQRFTLGY
ncbi:MAG TPA: NAD(P)-dependent oxidoreductase [Nevskia sp.]|nr:NAD(P)-dependent oxidoreductase [Nevskia sp.]